MAVPQRAKLFALFAMLLPLCNGTDRRKIVIILGAPCAGCGTESPNIVHALNIPHLDTGNMLRQAVQAGTAAGLVAGKMMKEGVLVTDDIVNKIVEDRIAQPDCANGFLLDGYPRNVAQSKNLDKVLGATGESVTDVLVLNVPMEGLQQCVLHRWTADGGDEWTSDYIAFRVPKSLKAGVTPYCQPDDLKHCNMWDDWTHEPLYRRADDNLKTLAERVKIYHSETYPVIDHYQSQGVIRDVNGYQPQRKVWVAIQTALGISPLIPDLQDQPLSVTAVTQLRQTRTDVPTRAEAAALVAAAATAIVVAVLTRPSKSDMAEALLLE